MSEVQETGFGRLKNAATRSGAGWLLECPGCGEWLQISEDMLHGRVSVNHDADGCPAHYHETHNFAAEVPDPNSSQQEEER